MLTPSEIHVLLLVHSDSFLTRCPVAVIRTPHMHARAHIPSPLPTLSEDPVLFPVSTHTRTVCCAYQIRHRIRQFRLCAFLSSWSMIKPRDLCFFLKNSESACKRPATFLYCSVISSLREIHTYPQAIFGQDILWWPSVKTMKFFLSVFMIHGL
jgi:hypothetical protein